ncbi:MAG TPA: class I SAM-dependent methyltransferase [Gammaproteobacteria bacterium]|nr:class I SAM-dependent methyltransferase [Gammaproteobacteria bacterium]
MSPIPTRQTLPEPDADARALSAELVTHIRAAIDATGGVIPFSRYMELALYAPGLGYYSAGSHKIGEAGDFITAPEISSLFSRCVARALAPALTELGDEAAVLEVGAGSGAMAADMLREWQAGDCLPRHYYILERSAELRARQAACLEALDADLRARVIWLDTLPDSFTGVVVANELLDALPVERFVVREGALRRLGVGVADERFTWLESPLDDEALTGRLERLWREHGSELAEGYVSELGLAAEQWTASMAAIIERGLLLLIDYGFPAREFYHAQRSQGTLMCHYRHHAHDDPFAFIGLQDITAHVDFSAVAQAATEGGMKLAGFTNQANFLLGSGITELASEVNPVDTRAQLEVAAQLKKLTLPHEMGELFKVIAFARDCECDIPGFQIRDFSAAL